MDTMAVNDKSAAVKKFHPHFTATLACKPNTEVDHAMAAPALLTLAVKDVLTPRKGMDAMPVIFTKHDPGGALSTSMWAKGPSPLHFAVFVFVASHLVGDPLALAIVSMLTPPTVNTNLSIPAIVLKPVSEYCTSMRRLIPLLPVVRVVVVVVVVVGVGMVVVGVVGVGMVGVVVVVVSKSFLWWVVVKGGS